MREGPSVGFFTCLEETDRNESSRNCLLLYFPRRPQLSGASLPSHYAHVPPSSLPPPEGRCSRQGTRVGGRDRDTWVQTPCLPLTQQATLANHLSCFHLVSLAKGTTTQSLALWALVRTKEDGRLNKQKKSDVTVTQRLKEEIIVTAVDMMPICAWHRSMP